MASRHLGLVLVAALSGTGCVTGLKSVLPDEVPSAVVVRVKPDEHGIRIVVSGTRRAARRQQIDLPLIAGGLLDTVAGLNLGALVSYVTPFGDPVTGYAVVGAVSAGTLAADLFLTSRLFPPQLVDPPPGRWIARLGSPIAPRTSLSRTFRPRRSGRARLKRRYSWAKLADPS